LISFRSSLSRLQSFSEQCAERCFYVGCIAGALTVAEYRQGLEIAGVHQHRDHPIGSGEPTSLDELHQCLEQVIDHRIDVLREPAREFDRTDVRLDVELARQIIGWRPEIRLPQGLAETWRHFSALAPNIASVSRAG
jgi:nucleoside-diphosphate-sugar epimerase